MSGDASSGAGCDGADFFMAGTKVGLLHEGLFVRDLSVLINRLVGSHRTHSIEVIDSVFAARAAAGSSPCVPEHA